MRKRTLMLIVGMTLFLCILALVSEKFFTSTHEPENDGSIIVTDGSQKDEDEQYSSGARQKDQRLKKLKVKLKLNRWKNKVKL